MRVIDMHTHLAPRGIDARDPIVASLRSAHAFLGPLLPPAARAVLELAGEAAIPLEHRLRDHAIGLADRALSLARNRAMLLGPLAQRLARAAAGPREASLLRGSPAALLGEMEDAGVHAAVVLPVPPAAPADQALASCASPRLIPFCCPVPGTPDIEEKIAAWKARGCRGIEMHPAIHGERPDSPFYRRVAEAALALALPVVAHTGALPGGVAEAAACSRTSAYEPLLRDFRKVRFVLAHMSLFRADEAIDVAVRRENVLLGTSFQPAGVVRRAWRRIGEERLVFGSGWPLPGSRMASAMDVVAEGLNRVPGAIERVLARNAEELLGLGTGAW